MSRKLISELEASGYDLLTARELVTFADSKPDDIAAELLSDVLDGKQGIIRRYLRDRGERPKLVSAQPNTGPSPPHWRANENRNSPVPSRGSTPPVRTPTPTAPQRRAATPTGTANSPKRKDHPYSLTPPAQAAPSAPAMTKTSNISKPSQKKENKEFNKQARIESVQDLDAAINELTVSASKREDCACMGARHGLLEMAPNCIECGKIICKRQGMGDCISCGAQLIPSDVLNKVLSLLRDQRQDIVSTIGKRALKAAGIESKQADTLQENAQAAKDNLEKLLSFQESGAARTKIIDESADFETPEMGTNIWASPEQQAQQLRNQQRQLRKQSEMLRSKRGTGRKVLSINLKGGRIIQQVEDYHSDSEPEAETDVQHVTVQSQVTEYFDTSQSIANPTSYPRSPEKMNEMREFSSVLIRGEDDVFIF